MLNLSEQNKELCFEDSTLKPLYIFLYYLKYDDLGEPVWQYFTTIDDAIILESLEITEGVLEGNNFELGSFVSPTIRVRLQNNGIRYKDMIAVPVQQIGDEYIAYFDGQIISEEVSQDGQTVTVEISSLLSQRLDTDIAEQLKELGSLTVASLIDLILGQTCGITFSRDFTPQFPNAGTVITLNENTLPQTLKTSEFLKMCGEFLGAHIVLKEKRTVNLDDMKTYQPIDYPIIDFIRLSNVDKVLEFSKLSTEENLFIGEMEQGSFNTTTGEHRDSNTRIRTKTNTLLSAGTYTLSNDQNYLVVVYMYDLKGAFLEGKSYIVWQNSPFNFTLDSQTYIEFGIMKPDGSTIIVSEVTGIKLNRTEISYTLPYYISSYVDKTKTIRFDGINVMTETGEQLQYTYFWGQNFNNVYTIENNIFFEALSTKSWQSCVNAVNDVGNYLKTQNFYNVELQGIYPPFIEGGDYLIVNYSNPQAIIPEEYMLVNNIELYGSENYIDTGVIPNSNDIELNIDFSISSELSNWFFVRSDGQQDYKSTLGLFLRGNTMIGLIGYYGGSIKLDAFELANIPINQKINFNLKCGNGNWQYSGAFKDSGTYYGGDDIATGTPIVLEGTEGGWKLYHFSYLESGTKLCDMYPCVRKSDGIIGLYDIIREEFYYVNGEASYQSGDIVIPILSATTRGIHSMRTDILCKATEINKN